MEIRGEEKIAAPREAVWRILNDTSLLIGCIPGREKLERVSPTRIEATILVKAWPCQAALSWAASPVQAQSAGFLYHFRRGEGSHVRSGDRTHRMSGLMRKTVAQGFVM